MKPLKQKISVTLDTAVIVAARSLAEREDRSLSQYINCILQHYLCEFKEQV